MEKTTVFMLIFWTGVLAFWAGRIVQSVQDED
jgi:hypothetical protein